MIPDETWKTLEDEARHNIAADRQAQRDNELRGLRRAMEWYDAHKNSKGSYDGEMFGDLRTKT